MNDLEKGEGERNRERKKERFFFIFFFEWREKEILENKRKGVTFF